MPHRRHRYRVRSSLVSLACVALLAGCDPTARYEIVAPGSSRGEIARNAGPIVTRDKLDYEIFQAENKVIVRFVNRTGSPLRLTEQSVAIDASGRSFVLEPQDVAPDQSGRILLPPSFAAERARTTPVATEVHVGGVDEGGFIGTRRDQELNEATGGSTGGAAAPAPGFRWPANALARVRLSYRIGESPEELTHEWSIRRTR